jgi:HAD superfamily hydrolase (TIGR01509 family)
MEVRVSVFDINLLDKEREMMIKGVLFDFDGTLTLPEALDFPAIKKELGCPSDQAILEYLETQTPVQRSSLMKILEEIEDQAAEASRPNRGAEKCLSVLKERGIVLGILTRNGLSSVKKALKKFDGVTIRDFAAVITRDESLPKPHPDGVHEAARQMGLSIREILMVGDFRFDIMAGSAAGARTVLLANREKSVMLPGDPDPDYVVSNLEEILDLSQTPPIQP